MNAQHMNLNIRYDAPEEVWNKIPAIYEQLDGWMGFGNGIPYWFSFNENEKHIYASSEPGGLSFSGLMNDQEWSTWVKKIKYLATQTLGYKVGEIETGEVD